MALRVNLQQGRIDFEPGLIIARGCRVDGTGGHEATREHFTAKGIYRGHVFVCIGYDHERLFRSSAYNGNRMLDENTATTRAELVEFTPMSGSSATCPAFYSPTAFNCTGPPCCK